MSKLLIKLSIEFKETNSDDNEKIITKQKIVDDTIDQVEIILIMMKDDIKRNIAIKKYNLKSTTCRWTWDNFVYPIYQDFVANGLVHTDKPKSSAVALKNFYNRSMNKQSKLHHDIAL